jgi:hypothetical protein
MDIQPALAEKNSVVSTDPFVSLFNVRFKKGIEINALAQVS